MRGLILVVLAAVLAGMLVFAIQNQEELTIYFTVLSWPSMPMWAPALTAGLGTMILCLLYGLISGAGWRIRHRQLSRHFEEHRDAVERLEKENLELRERVTTSVS
jgi:hypothetical protein